MAPEMPTAMYRLGRIAMPVCPTCSWWGRQPMSDTGREQAVVAPMESARSSMMPQFSGPLRPRPAETTSSASGSGARSPPLGWAASSTSTRAAPRSGWKASTVAVPPCASGMPMALVVVVITREPVVPVTRAVALPLKTLRV